MMGGPYDYVLERFNKLFPNISLISEMEKSEIVELECQRFFTYPFREGIEFELSGTAL